jgi:hypothetical protein
MQEWHKEDLGTRKSIYLILTLALLAGLFMWDSAGPAAAWGLAIKSG